MKRITLLKAWSYKDTTYEPNDHPYLEVDDFTANKLIKDGIAEMYVEPDEDVKKDNDATDKAPEFTRDTIKEVVAEALKEATKPNRREIPVIDSVKDVVANDPKGGFQNFPHFLREVAKSALSRRDTEPIERWRKGVKTLGVMVDHTGGDLVPVEFLRNLLDKTHESGLVFNRATQVPLAGNTVKVPAVDETSRADGSRQGGVRSYWEDEAESHTESEPKFAQVTLSLNKVSIQTPVSDELLEDAAFPMESLLTQMFARELAFALDEACINGTGAGQPLGVVNAGCVVSQAKESGQTASTIVFENIVKMYSRLWARSRGNAVWFINQDTLPQLFTMALNVGTGGAAAYLPANGLADAPYGTLMGRPVVPIEQCATLGTVGDIILADMSQYLVAQKSGGIQTASSMHVYFATDRMAYKASLRVDGQPWWRTALTPYKGTNTQSPFITLATRS